MPHVTSSGSTNYSDGGSGRSGGGGSVQVGGRSALISDLVAQLKRGDITKNELFSRLQQLQGPSSAAAGSLVGAATSISTPTSVSTTGSANIPPASASAVVGLETTEASPPATAIPGESPAAAGESSVFFSAHDRQAIIKKIADERRRRALEVIRATPPAEEGPIGTRRRSSSSSRTNAQAPSQPLTPAELSAPVVHSDPIAVDSYAASQPPQQPQHQQQGQSFSRKDSHPPPTSTASDTHSSNRNDRDGDGLVGAIVVEEDLGRRTAWEEGQERQQAAASTYDTSSDEFPFPGTHDQSNSRSHGGASRQGQLVVDTNEDSRGETFGAPSSSSRGVTGGGGTLGEGAEPMTINQPSSRNSTDRIDATARGNRRLSRGGSGSSNGRIHDRNSLIASRRRSSGGSGGSGVSAGDGPSSPGWSSYARRLSGNSGGGAFGRGGAGGSGYGTEDNTRGGGGSERYGGDRREYQAVSGRSAKGQEGSSPLRFRHDDVTDHQQNSSHRVEQARVGERRASQSGSWTHGGAGVREGELQGRDRDGRVAGDRNRQPESRAVGRGRWMEGSASLEEEGSGTEMAGQQQLQQQQPQEQPQREEWDEARGGGSGGGGGRQHQASERTVDEDAYRFRSFSEERARRGEELVRRELMSECTFRPKIKGLPQSYGTTNHDDTPFLQRVNQWQKDKEKDADTRKAHGQDKELEECTFTPRVNSVSRRAARSRRQALGENHLTVDDRLYDEFVRRELDRSHLAAEKAAREKEQLHEECTFRPDLPTKRAADAIAAAAAAGAAAGGGGENGVDWGYTVPRGRSRYREAAAAVAAAVATGGVGSGGSVWGAGRRANGGRVNGRKLGGRGGGRRHWELEPCTFTPNVIGARKGMDQAQQYLQYDVVERLTGAAFRSSDGSDCNDSEGSEEGEALLRERGGTLRTGLRQGFGVGREGISTTNWDSGDGDKLAYGPERQEAQSPRQRKGGGGSDTSSSFHAFLSRQNKLETDKLKHIDQIQVMRQHTFQPEICAESTKIHKESNKGDFLQRVARDAARKEHEAVRQKAAGLHDPDCTFKPQITARSATLQARSVVELSRGDQLKRETTQRLSRLRAEQELLADTTFRPRINADAASRMAVSKLKVVSDPDNYISTVETLRRRKEESVVKGAIEKAAKEVEGCTFKPETTECPAYITRIAQSICASKALPGPGGGKKQVNNAKPDWR